MLAVTRGGQVLVDGDKESIKIQLLDVSLHVEPYPIEPLSDRYENTLLSVFRKELQKYEENSVVLTIHENPDGGVRLFEALCFIEKNELKEAKYLIERNLAHDFLQSLFGSRQEVLCEEHWDLAHRVR